MRVAPSNAADRPVIRRRFDQVSDSVAKCYTCMHDHF